MLDKIPNYKLKRTYDELVDKGYVSRKGHMIHELDLYCYTDKCDREKYWNTYTVNARSLVLDKHGNIISKGLPKIFEYEDELTIPKEEFTPIEKIDGASINAFWYNGELIFNTKSEFSNVYTDYAYQYHQPKMRWLNQFLTVCCEAVLPEDKDPVERIVKHPPGLYLTAGIKPNLESASIFGELFFCENLSRTERGYNEWRKYIPQINYEYTDSEDVEDFCEKNIKTANTEGWILVFSSGYRIKVHTNWYLIKRRELLKVNSIIRNGIEEGRSLDDILKHPALLHNKTLGTKIDLIKSYVDREKLRLAKAFVKEYSPDMNKFRTRINKYTPNQKNYLITAYHNKPWNNKLISDAMDTHIKNV